MHGGVFQCILEFAESLEDEILFFSICFNAMWGVFECILGLTETKEK